MKKILSQKSYQSPKNILFDSNRIASCSNYILGPFLIVEGSIQKAIRKGSVWFSLTIYFTKPEISVVLQDGAFCSKKFGWVNVHLSGSGRRNPTLSSSCWLQDHPQEMVFERGQRAGKSVTFFCALEWVMAP